MRQYAIVALACVAVVALMAAEAPANMSGTWKLNTERSKFKNHAPPSALQIVIQHNEPHLKYSGRIYDPQGEGDSEFDFDGVIDGREYPVKVDTTDQRITFKRLSPYTVQSDMHTVDGSIKESATTTISADGKMLVRNITREGPQGKQHWIEAYDKL